MILKLQFAGIINKVEVKTVGGKTLAEISLCKKNYAKEGAEPTFTWLRVGLWEPKEWQVAKLVKGAFVAGSGDFSLRSYEKDGVKHESAECRCTSFDVEVAEVVATPASLGVSTPAPRTTQPTSGGGASGGMGSDEPPFLRIAEGCEP